MINLGITSVYLQGIDNAEITETIHARRALMIPVSAAPRNRRQAAIGVRRLARRAACAVLRWHANVVAPEIAESLSSLPQGMIESVFAILQRLRTVVCVTAAENYALERIERQGTGPEKYAAAGVTFTGRIA